MPPSVKLAFSSISATPSNPTVLSSIVKLSNFAFPLSTFISVPSNSLLVNAIPSIVKLPAASIDTRLSSSSFLILANDILETFAVFPASTFIASSEPDAIFVLLNTYTSSIGITFEFSANTAPPTSASLFLIVISLPSLSVPSFT